MLFLVWTDETAEVGRGFGEVVAAAGDVDADGFADVVVAAPHDDSDPGFVSVYRGSVVGPEAVASWTVESERINVGFGSAVAAGDVNGDGFSDLAIGAPEW